MNKAVFVIILLFWVRDIVQSELSIQAPQIICPKGDSYSFDTPDNYTNIRILPESDTNLNVTWLVQWMPLSVTTQRQTILTWKIIRDLENQLNGEQEVPLLYAIRNDKLLSGINYIFNITTIASNEDIITKRFSIKYIKDNHDTKDAYSMTLLGGRSIYANLDYTVEADVTTCSVTQDYYFAWEVYSTASDHNVNVSTTTGSTLEIPRHSLMPGVTYEVKCRLKNQSNDALIKEVKIPLQVYSRQLHVFLNTDRLMVSINTAFTVEAMVVNYDYEDYTTEYEWQCFHKGNSCDFIENSKDSAYNFSSGIPNIGEYIVMLTVSTLNQSVNVNSTIVVMITNLPVIQLQPVNRIINEGANATFLGKASRVAPSCNLTWYFTAEKLLNSSEPHGIAISETNTAFSVEENFLSELADFSNETDSIEIEVDVTSPGRARFVAECNCSSSFSCGNIAYAEVNFQLNEKPKVDLVVSSETGTALETLFEIRSRATDADVPLRYSFYCAIGSNETLLLASYLDYGVVETFLPYIDGETVVWVEVCDAFAACSESKKNTIQVRSSSGRTFDLLLEYARAYIRRCEIMHLMHVTISSFISYSNAGQSELAALFMRALLESLPDLHSGCSLPQYRYAGILSQLTAAGFDIAPLLA